MKYLVLIFVLVCFEIKANTITVCKSCKIQTIKEAVSLSKDGDSILVKKGIYKEQNISILKSIYLIGENNPVIDGEFKGTIIKVTANNFTIEGLTLMNVGQSYTKDFAAILVSRSKQFVLKNITLKKVFFGFLIEKSHYGTILNNTITSNADNEANSGNGIHMWHCSHMKIQNNKISGLRDGIYFEFVKNSTISNNISQNNIRYGLHFMFSNNNVYFKNEFKNNGAGVAVMFSKFIIMHDNVFHYNWGMASYGLLLKEIYDAQIENNTFEQNTIGINVENCSRIDYNKNKFIRNGWALKFSGGCYKNIFKRNDFIYNAFDLSYNSQLNSNRFENNYWSDYTGYDLNKDGIGDVPYRPVKLFSYIVNQTPEALVLLRSLFVDIINFSEKVSPVFTPDNLVDKNPLMKIAHD
ncbi:MAG: nitrous oxide reductase family maturation protein NosD [Lutibacter sp.]|uniref:nitrous oxide reductase family maturation protein NosD n=1 Tax=Lutibacter sp. TaxID=1925666 RepID=UPI00299CDCA4|nr:nitrous oxide reductase family maturation protein NosD [Lutibacter sp.]MDX1829492.1 nitrous oxide reductase family maturation protein NosD [Lutibacter sp.]